MVAVAEALRCGRLVLTAGLAGRRWPSCCAHGEPVVGKDIRCGTLFRGEQPAEAQLGEPDSARRAVPGLCWALRITWTWSRLDRDCRAQHRTGPYMLCGPERTDQLELSGAGGGGKGLRRGGGREEGSYGTIGMLRGTSGPWTCAQDAVLCYARKGSLLLSSHQINMHYCYFGVSLGFGRITRYTSQANYINPQNVHGKFSRIAVKMT